jgi:hypothetical protein
MPGGWPTQQEGQSTAKEEGQENQSHNGRRGGEGKFHLRGTSVVPRGRGLRVERGVSHGGGGSGGNVVLSNLFRVTVKEHIDHDIPLLVALHGAAETQNLTAEHPIHETDGGAALVVGGDGNIDILEGRVAVAEGNHGDVGGSSLTNGLKRGEK